MKDSNEAKTKLPTETGFTASAGSVSWEDCERKFREMTAAFGKDMPKYRKLGAEYDAMLDAYERDQETPNKLLSEQEQMPRGDK